MSLIPKAYDYKSFQLADGQSDYDVKANIVELFDNVNVAKRVVIYTDKDISFKFNSVLFSVVPLLRRYQPYQSPKDFLDVTNIFLTNNSGATATIKIWLVQ